jgi:small subunit ribosomal protein S5
LSSKPPDDDAPSENSILPENPIPLSESSSTCLEKSPTEAPSIHLEPIVSLEDPSSTFSLESLDTGYPNLMTPDPFIDTHDAEIYPPDKNSPYLNKVVVRNDPSFFLDSAKGDSSSQSDAQVETEDEISPLSNLPLNAFQINKLFRFPIMTRRITQQTGKGKIHRMYTMVVVGNGNGLVGYGEGKDDEAARASEKAFAQAVRNMDWVERFEKRTIWTEMDTKLGATRLILRPRPVGFGLRCNPNIHQVLKAAGIKDISAKVWGSRNPLNVVKALFRMLQAGNAPLSMGDGIGGGGRKLNKGSGLRSKSEVERERGRKLIDLRD